MESVIINWKFNIVNGNKKILNFIGFVDFIHHPPQIQAQFNIGGGDKEKVAIFKILEIIESRPSKGIFPNNNPHNWHRAKVEGKIFYK